MRTGFRRSVFLSIGLMAAGTLLTSDLMASPASALRRGRDPYYGRTVDRESIAKHRIVRVGRTVLPRAGHRLDQAGHGRDHAHAVVA